MPFAPPMTQAEFIAELTNRFGPDPMGWAFVCPACNDIATGAEIRAALAENPRTKRGGEPVTASDILGQECIGRTLGALRRGDTAWTGRGCDWCAYGLIPGPLTIHASDGREFSAFHIAPVITPDPTREATEPTTEPTEPTEPTA